jgi:hypothetical protein
MHNRCFDFDEKVGIWLHTFGVGSNGGVELGDIFLAMQE